MKFFIPCSPPKSLSKNNKQLFVRNGRAMQTDSKNTRESKSTILQLLQPHAPKTPLSGPLKLRAVFFYPYPKSTSKKQRETGSPMTVKPDVDGIATGLMDCMQTLGFFSNDSQVYCLQVEKFLSPEKCGILVEVEERI